jgi:uncharacterized protein
MNDRNLRTEPSIGAPSVVITGATQGIGRALAEEFARGGHTLLLVARDEASLARTEAELSGAYGVEVKVAALDLSNVEGCVDLEQALRRFGLYADILVNNAGMMSSGFFQDEDPENIKRLVDLDALAVMDLTRRFLPGMLARGRGGVLNVASMTGFMPVPYQAAYAAANAFVLSLTRALAYETMGTGVRVSALAPGAVATRLHAKAGAQNSRYLQLLPVMSAEDVARIAYRKFWRGRKVIVPGWLNRLNVVVMHFVPDLLLVPLMGWFFRVRDEAGIPQLPEPLNRAEGTLRGPVSL